MRKTFLRLLKFLQIKEGGPNFWGEPLLQNVWIISSPHLFFNFKRFLDPNSASFLRFQSILHELGRIFSESWNFLKLRREGPNFCGEPILQNVGIIWSPLLYFNFESFLDPNSWPFISFQPIFQNLWIIWSPLLYLSLKSPMDQNSFSFIRFQFILHESGRLFSDSWRFYKLRSGDLISGGNIFCRMSELFGPPFCI